MLSTAFFYADDWRNLNTIFSSASFLGKIFYPHNGHLSFLQNLIFSLNLWITKGSTFALALFNLLITITSAFTIYKVAHLQFRTQHEHVKAKIYATLCAAPIFWIYNSVSIYWSVPHLVLLGAILVAYSLSSILKRNNNILFLSGLFISVFSHGSGLVVLFFPCLKHLITKLNLRLFLKNTLWAFAGVLIYELFGNNSIRASLDLNIINALISAPLFLGAPLGIMQLVLTSSSNYFFSSLFIGIVGVIIYFFFLIRVFKEYRQNREDPFGLFFILIGLFSVMNGILIYIVRSEGNLDILLKGQYFSLSLLFWISLFSLGLRNLIQIGPNILRDIIVAFVFLILFLINTSRIDLRLPLYNQNIMGTLDIIVSPDKSGNERFLVQPNSKDNSLRELVMQTNESLKFKKLGIYEQNWPNNLGKVLTDVHNIYDSQYQSKVIIEGKIVDHTFEVNLESNHSFFSRPKTILIVQNNIIQGFGLRMAEESKGIISKFLPHLNFPLFSDNYYCQMSKTTDIGDINGLSFYALSGNACYEL